MEVKEALANFRNALIKELKVETWLKRTQEALENLSKIVKEYKRKKRGDLKFFDYVKDATDEDENFILEEWVRDMIDSLNSRSDFKYVVSCEHHFSEEHGVHILRIYYVI